ncbi:MAG: hypothetical protein IJT23_10290 [Clostridia bacterium]|nr:hypothetical protein [Clostridia bacterium]
MSEWTRIPHDGDYDNLDSTLIIPITQKKVHTQNLPRIIQGEENADILTFETDRFYNGVDLTATVISIIYKNANGTFYERAVNVEYSDDKLRFSWAVSKNATACKGILVINLEFDGLDAHKEVITVKSVRFPIEIEPAVLGKEISDYKSDNWVEETNARVKNLENECKELSGDITDLDEKLSQKADKDTVASPTQLGMIKLLASAGGQNRSGLVVDEQTGVTYINARADRGIYRDGAGQLQINPATDEEVATGTEQYKPVTPKTLKPFISYLSTPTQVGVWVDGTPIWRATFSLTDSELLDKNPALWTDRCVVFNDFIEINELMDVKIVTNYAIYASQSEPCIVDSFKLEYDGNIGFVFDDNIREGVHDVFYGFIEFVTPKNNIMEA